jgi:hypothetical protein
MLGLGFVSKTLLIGAPQIKVSPRLPCSPVFIINVLQFLNPQKNIDCLFTIYELRERSFEILVKNWGIDHFRTWKKNMILFLCPPYRIEYTSSSFCVKRSDTPAVLTRRQEQVLHFSGKNFRAWLRRTARKKNFNCSTLLISSFFARKVDKKCVRFSYEADCR